MISRLVVQRREPFANGYEFPVTGAYEKLVGKVYGEVDPRNRLNRIIVNLDRAPRNRRGRVKYRSDFFILKPVDMARGNGKIFLDAPNRGSKRLLSCLDDEPATKDPGPPAPSLADMEAFEARSLLSHNTQLETAWPAPSLAEIQDAASRATPPTPTLSAVAPHLAEIGDTLLERNKKTENKKT